MKVYGFVSTLVVMATLLGLASAGNLRGEPRALQQAAGSAASSSNAGGAVPREVIMTMPQPVGKEDKETAAAKDAAISVSIPYVGTVSVNYNGPRHLEAAVAPVAGETAKDAGYSVAIPYVGTVSVNHARDAKEAAKDGGYSVDIPFVGTYSVNWYNN